MHYLILDEEGYLLGVSETETDGPAVDDAGGIERDAPHLRAYRWDGERLAFDGKRYGEITERIEETQRRMREQAEKGNLAVERMEAQITYTAIMTDTLLEV